MTSKAFFDTNILVYSIEQNNLFKREIAKNLLKSHRDTGSGVISMQVLQELLSVCTRKLGVEPIGAKRILKGFADLEIISLTTELLDEAVDVMTQHSVSCWDGSIFAAARAGRCTVIYSEDLQPGFAYQGVRVSNPFVDGSVLV